MARYAFTTFDASGGSAELVPRVCDVLERTRDAAGRTLVVEIEGQRHTATVLSDRNPFLVLVNHRPLELFEQDGRFAVLRGGPTFEEAHARNSRRGANEQTSGAIVAPMPGKVVRVLCQLGNMVEVGTPLVVLEAMKMENELRAARTGRVTAIHVSEGQAVEGRAKLVELG